MKRLLAALCVLALVGTAVAVPGLSGTEHPVPVEKTEQDVSSDTSFSLRNTGDGDVVLHGDGSLEGTEQTRTGTGDTSVSWTNHQRNGVVTFHGKNVSDTTTFNQGYDSLPSYETANVTVENGKLALEIGTTTSIVDDYEDGDISEYSGSTGSFSVDSDRAESGSYSLQNNGGASYDKIYGDGLTSKQPEPGDNITLYIYPEAAGSGNGGLQFRVHNASGGKILNIQAVFWAQKFNLRTGTTDDKGSYDWPYTQSWHRFEVVWPESDTEPITTKLYDSSGNLEATRSAAWDSSNISETTYIGVQGLGGSKSRTHNLDNITVTSSTSHETGYGITKFDSSTTAWNEAQVAFTQDETNGNVTHYVAFDTPPTDPDNFVGFESANVWKEIPEDPDAVYVKTVLNRSSGDGPTVDQVDTSLRYEEPMSNPSFTLNGTTVSYSGTLGPGETATKSYGDIADGSYSVTTDKSFQWDFTSHNDGRVHVTGLSVSGQSYTVDRFLGAGQSLSVSSSFADETTVSPTIADDAEGTALSKVVLNGSLDAWKAIYEGNGHELTEEQNVVFGYSSSPSSGNRVRGLNVSSMNGTTTFEVHSWTPSNNDVEAREIFDGQASGDVRFVIDRVAQDEQYVVFRDGEKKQTVTPEDGTITFTQYGDVEVFTKIQDNEEAEYNAGSGGVYVPSSQFGLLSYYRDLTGLPPITGVVAGAGLALGVVYLVVIRS